jgi:transposase
MQAITIGLEIAKRAF